MNNSTQVQKVPFSVTINSPAFQRSINNALQNPDRAAKFVASVVSAVTATPALQECAPETILSTALLGESLKLSPSPQLGHFYMVPFKNKKLDRTEAQFVIGYKGLIQLALRSGQYKKINVISVKDGELVNWDPVTEDARLNIIQDEDEREARRTVGYLAMFEYINGFRKTIYWSRSKMERHADKYSQAFHLNAVVSKYPNQCRVSYQDFLDGKYPKNESWKYSSFWYQDFDGMAHKTMLRNLISKWGIMSVEMQTAMVEDIKSETAEAEAKMEDPFIPDLTPKIPGGVPEGVPDAAQEASEPEEPVIQELSLDDL